jgi:hypothetical protein
VVKIIIASLLLAHRKLLLAIPGMIGEAVVLSHRGIFMPRLQATSGGRYGAFLFATYALVLGLAEVGHTASSFLTSKAHSFYLTD